MAIKLEDIEFWINRLNKSIEPNGIKVVLSRRYGYKALDLYRLDGRCLDTIVAGLRSGQVMEYINAMLKGMELYAWKKS